MVSMSGMKKAASSIGHTMIHRVGMSQVGLYITAKDISNDSLDPNICNVGRHRSSLFSESEISSDRFRKGCCKLHTLLSDYIHQIS